MMIENYEIVSELMEILTTGEPPEGFHMDDMPPAMTREQAFSIVYLLQEKFAVIVDHIEMCEVCGNIFDTWEGENIIGWTGELDEFYHDHGVTEKMIRDNEGHIMCSDECESRFWKMKLTN